MLEVERTSGEEPAGDEVRVPAQVLNTNAAWNVVCVAGLGTVGLQTTYQEQSMVAVEPSIKEEPACDEVRVPVQVLNTNAAWNVVCVAGLGTVGL